MKVATKARKETQITEKTNRKLTKCVLGAAGDTTGQGLEVVLQYTTSKFQ